MSNEVKTPQGNVENGWLANLNILIEEARTVEPKAHKLANDITVNTILTEEEIKQIEQQKYLSKKK